MVAPKEELFYFNRARSTEQFSTFFTLLSVGLHFREHFIEGHAMFHPVHILEAGLFEDGNQMLRDGLVYVLFGATQ